MVMGVGRMAAGYRWDRGYVFNCWLSWFNRVFDHRSGLRRNHSDIPVGVRYLAYYLHDNFYKKSCNKFTRTRICATFCVLYITSVTLVTTVLRRNTSSISPLGASTTRDATFRPRGPGHPASINWRTIIPFDCNGPPASNLIYETSTCLKYLTEKLND
jgi:hypothetical protein